MPVNVSILVNPGLRRSSQKISELLRRESYSTLFLNFPKTLEEPLNDIADGAQYQNVLENIEKSELLLGFSDWKYKNEPILESLQNIRNEKPNIKIFCYKDDLSYQLSYEVAVDIAKLGLRSLITGKININKWKELLIESIRYNTKGFEVEKHFISEKAKNQSLCISGFLGKWIKIHLKKEGYEVKLEYLEVPYFFKPLEVLCNLIELEAFKGKAVSDKVAEKLIYDHLNFLKNHVTSTRNLDEAYYSWAPKTN